MLHHGLSVPEWTPIFIPLPPPNSHKQPNPKRTQRPYNQLKQSPPHAPRQPDTNDKHHSTNSRPAPRPNPSQTSQNHAQPTAKPPTSLPQTPPNPSAQTNPNTRSPSTPDEHTTTPHTHALTPPSPHTPSGELPRATTHRLAAKHRAETRWKWYETVVWGEVVREHAPACSAEVEESVED
jgi:hypothetical protein